MIGIHLGNLVRADHRLDRHHRRIENQQSPRGGEYQLHFTPLRSPTILFLEVELVKCTTGLEYRVVWCYSSRVGMATPHTPPPRAPQGWSTESFALPAAASRSLRLTPPRLFHPPCAPPAAVGRSRRCCPAARSARSPAPAPHPPLRLSRHRRSRAAARMAACTAVW